MKFRFRLGLLSIFVAVVLLGGCAALTPMNKAKKLEAKEDYPAAISSYQEIIQKDPNSSDAQQAQLAIGKLYLEKLNKPEEGLKAYQQVVTNAPQSEEAAEALYRMGIHYFKAEDYKNAEEMFNRVVNGFPQLSRSQDAQLLLAKTYEKAEQYNQATSVYDSVIQRDPQSKRAAQAMLSKGKLYKDKLEDKDKATETYQQLVKERGSDLEAREMVEAAKKELQEMGAEVPKPVDKLATPEARRAARREAQRERDRPRSSYAQSSSAKKTARRTGASGFGVDPESIMQSMQIPTDSQGTYYDAMFMVANMKYQEGSIREAGALYERAIQLGLKDPLAYRNLSACYGKIGLTDKAREVLKQGMSKDPAMLDNIISSGEVQYHNEDYDAALETYKSALGLSRSKDSAIYHRIGLVYKRLKDVDKEIDAYGRSISINPNNKDVFQLMAEALYYRKGNRTRAGYYQDAADGKVNSYEVQKELGDLCYSYENYNWAETKYKTAARVLDREKKKLEAEKAGVEQQKEAATEPAEIRKHQNEVSRVQREIDDLATKILLMKVRTAITTAKKGKMEEGKQQMDTLTAENPDHAVIHYGLAEFALMADDNETAVAEFKKAIELKPKLLEPNLALGEYYITQGNKEEALTLWEAYKKKNPRDKMIKNRVKELQKELHPEPESKPKAPSPGSR